MEPYLDTKDYIEICIESKGNPIYSLYRSLYRFCIELNRFYINFVAQCVSKSCSSITCLVARKSSIVFSQLNSNIPTLLKHQTTKTSSSSSLIIIPEPIRNTIAIMNNFVNTVSIMNPIIEITSYYF